MKVVAVDPKDEKLLRSAERVHRQLRTALRADYVGRMREVLAGGAEMAVALVDGEVAGSPCSGAREDPSAATLL